VVGLFSLGVGNRVKLGNCCRGVLPTRSGNWGQEGAAGARQSGRARYMCMHCTCTVHAAAVGRRRGGGERGGTEVFSIKTEGEGGGGGVGWRGE